MPVQWYINSNRFIDALKIMSSTADRKKSCWNIGEVNFNEGEYFISPELGACTIPIFELGKESSVVAVSLFTLVGGILTSSLLLVYMYTWHFIVIYNWKGPDFKLFSFIHTKMSMKNHILFIARTQNYNWHLCIIMFSLMIYLALEYYSQVNHYVQYSTYI